MKFSNVHHLRRIADKLSKAGQSWGCVAATDANGRTIWIADAHRRDGKWCFAHAGEKFGTRIGDLLGFDAKLEPVGSLRRLPKRGKNWWDSLASDHNRLREPHFYEKVKKLGVADSPVRGEPFFTQPRRKVV